MFRAYKIEYACVHESDQAKREDTYTDVFVAESAESAWQKCVEYNEREGYIATRIIGIWVEADSYWAAV